METKQNLVVEQPYKSARNLTYLTYILYFLGVISLGTFSTFGVILAYVRRKGLEGTLYHSHLTYLIKTYWIYLTLIILGFILLPVRYIGLLILIPNYIWYLYRLVSGFTKLSDNKSI